MPIAKFLKDPLFWLFVILVLGAGLLINSVNVDSLSAQTQIVGEGIGRYLAKWVPATVLLPGDFNVSLGDSDGGGSATCNSVPLSWTTSSGATTYKILKGTPRADISPYQPYTTLNFIDPEGSANSMVSQNTDYVYQIAAYNSAGTKRSNALNVTTPYCAPMIDIFSDAPASVYQGQSSKLTWTSTNADSCSASGAWSGSKSTSGSEVVYPATSPSATYTLTCSGPGGSAVKSATIDIAPLGMPGWKEIIPR